MVSCSLLWFLRRNPVGTRDPAGRTSTGAPQVIKNYQKLRWIVARYGAIQTVVGKTYHRAHPQHNEH